MRAILPVCFDDVPLRDTYAADLALAYVLRSVVLTKSQRNRFVQHVLDSHERALFTRAITERAA